MTEMIEGRNAVLEAFRSGKCVDKLFILDGCQDGPVRTIAREARKHDTIVKFVPKERLDSMSERCSSGRDRTGCGLRLFYCGRHPEKSRRKRGASFYYSS